jgi:hypothetical protein
MPIQQLQRGMKCCDGSRRGGRCRDSSCRGEGDAERERVAVDGRHNKRAAAEGWEMREREKLYRERKLRREQL